MAPEAPEGCVCSGVATLTGDYPHGRPGQWKFPALFVPLGCTDLDQNTFHCKIFSSRDYDNGFAEGKTVPVN